MTTISNIYLANTTDFADIIRDNKKLEARVSLLVEESNRKDDAFAASTAANLKMAQDLKSKDKVIDELTMKLNAKNEECKRYLEQLDTLTARNAELITKSELATSEAGMLRRRNEELDRELRAKKDELILSEAMVDLSKRKYDVLLERLAREANNKTTLEEK